jgi:hypothetical protein
VKSIHELAPQLANVRAFWLGYGAEDCLDGLLTLYRSGLNSPILNGVLRSGDDIDGAIEEAGTRLGGVPWTWRVGPDSPRWNCRGTAGPAGRADGPPACPRPAA